MENKRRSKKRNIERKRVKVRRKPRKLVWLLSLMAYQTFVGYLKPKPSLLEGE